MSFAINNADLLWKFHNFDEAGTDWLKCIRQSTVVAINCSHSWHFLTSVLRVWSLKLLFFMVQTDIFTNSQWSWCLTDLILNHGCVSSVSEDRVCESYGQQPLFQYLLRKNKYSNVGWWTLITRVKNIFHNLFSWVLLNQHIAYLKKKTWVCLCMQK